MVAANSSDNEECENAANCLSIKSVDACIRHNSIFEIKETPRLTSGEKICLIVKLKLIAKSS
jgi:hypothetical protein